MNILLVDDEPLEIEQMEYLITKHMPHATIWKASDASQAIRIARKTPIRLAFLDIQMPGKSGLELAKEMRQETRADLVMVTAFQSFEFAQQAIKVGVLDYLTKPIIEEDLVRVLSNYTAHSNYSDTIRNTLQIIHEEFAEKLTLSTLAARIHINPAYLSRKFQEEVGTGFAEYMNHYRLAVAKRMLIEKPDASISSIAEECGFNSQHYFSQMFRKECKETPRDYRARELRME